MCVCVYINTYRIYREGGPMPVMAAGFTSLFKMCLNCTESRTKLKKDHFIQFEIML